jgi:exodeoxyribonuclease V alpha subunit
MWEAGSGRLLHGRFEGSRPETITQTKSIFKEPGMPPAAPEPMKHRDRELRLTHIDRHFAMLMMKLAGSDDRNLWLAAALTSQATQGGHVCLDLVSLKRFAVSEYEVDNAGPYPELQEWISTLKDSAVVGAPGEFRPLVLDDSHRLYLYRYWRYEQLLADFLRTRIRLLCQAVNLTLLQEGLDQLFPQREEEAIDWQRIAALTAVCRMFSVITGGPGTGKTSTVVKILVLLLQQAKGTRMDIALAAPTGKAAAKLKESVKSAKERLNCTDEIRDAIPEETSTLHRLLGTIPGMARFRFDHKSRLPYDVVVVDEASMVDLPLMAKLTQAMPDHARLILLGDRDQLASVEPGAVFGDICDAGTVKPTQREAAEVSGVSSQNSEDGVSGPSQSTHSIVVLKKSFRFAETSGISLLSQAVNSGEGKAALELLTNKAYPDISWQDAPLSSQLEQRLQPKILQTYRNYLEALSIEIAFKELGRFQILCALRGGPYGVASTNQLAELVLARAELIHPRGRWYRGQPVMVTQNDYPMKLFNGDLGIIDYAADTGDLKAFFPSVEGLLRSVLPMRLPEHETAYAMTVHKSQGSEFDEVLFLLPNTASELLTRELIYTGITRARKAVEIWGNREVFLEAVSRRLERKSGLKDALRG